MVPLFFAEFARSSGALLLNFSPHVATWDGIRASLPGQLLEGEVALTGRWGCRVSLSEGRELVLVYMCFLVLFATVV